MLENPPDPEFKSAERLAFEIYLRTGRRLARADAPERKFNPYHDPRNGQFTFAPGGARSLGGRSAPRSRGLRKRTQALALEGPAKPVDASAGVAGERNPARSAAVDNRATAQDLNQYRPNPRARTGGNGGPPINDPLIITQAIPALQNSPAGAIVAVPAALFDLTGPASEATGALHNAVTKSLIKQIQAIDPDYHYDSLGPARTFQGRVNEINALRFRRALAFYQKRNDFRPLQVEVLRIMQQRADIAYDEAVKQYDAGRLAARLSREEAIGNYIDAAVRADLRRVFNVNRVDISRDQPVRVVGREYDTSGTDRTYRIPDARVGNIAFDVTLTPKSLATAQVRGFFNADFRPDAVVIVRPRQLGGRYSYAIKRPGK